MEDAQHCPHCGELVKRLEQIRQDAAARIHELMQEKEQWLADHEKH